MKKLLKKFETNTNKNTTFNVITKSQLAKVKGGTWFEDDVEFVKQTDSIKGR